ncbi:MAG: 30S ribosomal protein S12 methylthiotransferase RimO [Lachnospiraceae bacterium]|nr:30S ribosomal protein S12 methylthiotransferase RimO [Lachnospiraceae bacterium]
MNLFFVSLGCDKNLVDSEYMIGLSKKAGYEIVSREEEADVIVINTCCFIHDAKEESIETILEMASYKENRCRLLVVTGCLAQRYPEEIREELPEVDIILGSANYDDIIRAIEQAMEKETEEQKVTMIRELTYLPDMSQVDRVITTGNHLAYLKIAEGCNKRCTYCIIPSIRGNYRSVPMEHILKEAEKLAADGIRELVLVAQETTVYGIDRYGRKMLPELLRKLCRIDGIEWIRILYCYPEEITEELIEVMATEDKICKYLDMPIQHSEDRVLKLMGRRTNRAELVEIIGKLRERIPEITLRTTLISGFPGETEEEHEAMAAFVDEMEFDRLGVFTYSPEEGTRAASMEEQIEEDMKIRRRDEIMELQQEISYDKNQQMVGHILKVCVEGYLFDEDIYVGRSEKDAPKVDGCVFVRSPEEIISGTFVDVLITEANEYDLIGDVYYGNEFTE